MAIILPRNLRLEEYLNQDKVWASKAGDISVADMDAVYRRKAADWLLRVHLTLFQLVMTTKYMDAEKEPDLDEMLSWADNRPSSWIRKTPLYLAVSEGIPTELLRRDRTR